MKRFQNSILSKEDGHKTCDRIFLSLGRSPRSQATVISLAWDDLLGTPRIFWFGKRLHRICTGEIIETEWYQDQSAWHHLTAESPVQDSCHFSKMRLFYCTEKNVSMPDVKLHRRY